MRIFIVLLALTLSGCVNTSDPNPEGELAATDPKVKKVCKREVPTGSHRTIVTCRTVEQAKQEREEARTLRNRPGSGRPAPGAGNTQ